MFDPDPKDYSPRTDLLETILGTVVKHTFYPGCFASGMTLLVQSTRG